MKRRIARFRHGIGFVEVIVAVLIAAVSALPVVYMVSSSRTDTSKAINYLRAVELANEVIEWAQGVKYEDLDDGMFSAFVGTLVEDNSGTMTPVPVRAAPPENPNWAGGNFAGADLKYSEQYGNAFFYREVEFEDVVGSTYFNDGMLKKMTVRVKWNEASLPSSVNSPDRDRQVELSVLILNDANMNY